MKKPELYVNRKGDVTYINANDGTDYVGGAQLLANDVPGALVVVSMNLKPHVRAEGVGTRLYEKAFEEACRQGLTITSDTMRSIYSEAFWRKQARKGRAKCVQRGRGLVYNEPIMVLRANLWAECSKRFRGDTAKADRCVDARLKAMTMGLPKPKPRSGDRDYWPCYRWALKPDKCGGSLNGLRGRRK